MQSALDRRQAITEVLSDRRFETIENLMAEFGVSRSTIKRDLKILGCSVPIYTVQGNGGGVRVADGWHAGRRYLRGDQEELLHRLMDGLQPDDQKVMQGILASFLVLQQPIRLPHPLHSPAATTSGRCRYHASICGCKTISCFPTLLPILPVRTG